MLLTGAVIAVVVLLLLLGARRRADLTREEVASEIEAFLDGSGGRWDWDDLTSVAIRDPELERIRQRCVGLPDEFPPRAHGHYCGPEGLEVLKHIARELRAKARAGRQGRDA